MSKKVRSDGRLQSKVYLPGGKYKYVYAHSPKELSKKVTELKLQLGKGLDISAANDTFERWSARWLKYKQVEVSHSRYCVLTFAVDKLAPIANMAICKIRLSDLQDIILDLYDDDYSYDTMSKVKSTAKQILQYAIDNKVIDYNAAQGVKIPGKNSPSDRRALTAEEQLWIAAPSDNRGHRAAMIMMYSGLRRGELIPLLWRDIDLDTKTIRVDKSVEIINGQSIVKSGAKSEAGVRTVYIPQVLADYLATVPRDNNLLVCPDAQGRMMSAQAFTRMWESYMAELNYKYGDFSNVLVPDKQHPSELVPYQKPKSRFAPEAIPKVIPHFTPHWLRHTFISLMYMAGVDIVTAQQQAGHSSVQTTLRIYTHLDGLYKAKTINKLDDYLSAAAQKNAAIGCQ